MRSIRSAATLLGILALATSVACGGSDSPTPETPSTPTATPASPAPAEMAVPEDQAVDITEGELPKGYPSDLPSYPDSTPALSMLIPGGGMVTFTSPASDREIFDFYKKQLPAQGWKVDATNEDPLTISSSKGARKAEVIIAPSGALTEIMISLEGS